MELGIGVVTFTELGGYGWGSGWLSFLVRIVVLG